MPLNEEQLVTLVTKLAQEFESFGDKFLVAVESRKYDFKNGPAQWYTPKGMVLRFLRIGTNIATAPEAKIGCAVLHGAIDVIGFSGTLKLVLELRRKHAGKKQQAKSNLPGV